MPWLLLLVGCAGHPQPPAPVIPPVAPVAPAPTPVPPPAVVKPTITAQVHLLPKPQGVSTERPVTTGTLADEQHGWMVADYTRLLATSDGGQTRTRIATPGILPVTVTMADGLHAWLTDPRGHLYRTADGGHTFEQIR